MVMAEHERKIIGLKYSPWLGSHRQSELHLAVEHILND